MKELSIKDKELLLQDLSARLPYGVIVTDNRHGNSRITEIDTVEETVYCDDFDEYVELDKCKPYLRPMSSMTEEEMREYHSLIEEQKNMSYFTFCSCVTRYLDSIHVDHRAIKDKDGKWKTMIQLGLALEAPEGMYNTK